MVLRFNTLKTIGFGARLIDESQRLYPDGPPNVPEEPCNLLLFGAVGCGKTTLQAAVARAWVPKRMDDGCPYSQPSPPMARFVMAPEFCRELRSTWNRGAAKTEADLLREMGKACQLYLDDLGLETDTAGAHEALLTVIKQREHAGNPTIVSTNLGPEDWRKKNERTASVLSGYVRVDMGHVDRRRPNQ